MAHLHRLFAIRATRISGLERASEGSQDKGRKMKITRAIRFTIIAVVMAGAVLATVVAPAAASARVFVSVGIAPPLIPVYDQPIAPGYGYLWTPGYWAYGPDGYYWVDGAWVYPPYEGALWTPGYWGWGGGVYLWNAGYWGRRVGYYGGINYGFGYFGTGFYGGYWNGGRLYYNGAYNHLGFHDGFVYNHPVAGFNGRPGGAAFTQHGEAQAFNRGSGLNGNNFANRGESRPQYNPAGQSRPQYNSGAARGYSGGSSFAQSRGGYSAPQARSYSAPAAQAHGYSGGGFSGGGGHFSGGGGGFSGGGHFSGGGGGGGAGGGGGGGRR